MNQRDRRARSRQVFTRFFRPGATFHISSSSVLSLSRCRSPIDCSLFHGRPRKPFGKWHAKLGPVGSFLNDPYCFRPRDFNGRRREATDDFAFLSEEKTYRECLDYSYHIIHICIMVSQCSPWLQLGIEVKPLMMPARVHLCLFYWM